MTSSSSMDQQISAILGSDLTHLETLILHLMTPSNEQRSQAESLFNSYKKDPTHYLDNLVVNLANLLENPNLSPKARDMSALLLGNLVQDELPLWKSLPESTRSRVKTGLLNCVVKEKNKLTIKILGNTISKLAADNGWPGLMNSMLDRVESDDFWLKESALLILAQLVEYVGDSLVPYRTRLHDVFMDCLGNGGSADVRIAALSAVINFIPCLSFSDSCKFEDLLPCMLRCVPAELNPGNEATARKALVLLIELAGTRPDFFRGLGRMVELVEMVEGMLQIAEAESLEEGTRHLAIQFVITLAEKICDLPQFITNGLPPKVINQGSDLTHLETLILDLMTPSNEQRSHAEFLFNSCKKDCPNTLAANLAKLLEHSPRLDVRAMSAILLRNSFRWYSLLEMTRSGVKSGLLNCAVNEENKPIIKILGNTISKLAADNDWPELMTFMLDRVASDDFWLKESAILIFEQLTQYVGDSLVPYITRLHDVFMDCLGNGGSADVRIAALSAVINFIQCLSYSHRRRFEDLLPPMLQCVTAELNPGNEATAQKALVLLIELAGNTRPGFFWGQRMVEVVEIMLQIAEAESLEEGTRHLAIEFVITLVEVDTWDLPQFILNRLCAILMRMLDIEDEAAWHSAENEDEDAGQSSNDSVGKEFLHRLATTYSGNAIVPVAYEYLSASNHEWQKHLAGLVALAQIAKVPSKLVEFPDLEQAVTMVLNSFQDPHPRVKWAAINAIGKLSTYVAKKSFDQLVTMVLDLFQDSHHRVRLAAIHATGQLSADLDPNLQLQYHRRVLAALAEAICDFEYPQVQKHAASAVINISKNYPRDTLTPDLVEIVGTLLEFRSREEIASDQTRILAIENLVKQFRVKLPSDTWASTRSPASRSSIPVITKKFWHIKKTKKNLRNGPSVDPRRKTKRWSWFSISGDSFRC